MPTCRASGAQRSGSAFGDVLERLRSWQRLREGVDVATAPEHPALHLDHVDCGEMVLDLGRRAAIFEQQAFIAAVIGVAHGGVHADVGGDAGQHDVANVSSILQHQFEVGAR